MAWNIFRVKRLKTLDKIYKAYDTIHDQYVERMGTENELFLAHAEELKAELWTLGAAFDIVISEEGPGVLREAEQEYGYIPFTSRACTKYTIGKELRKVHTLELYRWWLRSHSGRCNLLVGKLLRQRYKLQVSVEIAKHLEAIEEAQLIGLLPKDISYDNISYADLNRLEAMYLFPKGKKGISDAPYTASISRY